jgi:hypothetical protein
MSGFISTVFPFTIAGGFLPDVDFDSWNVVAASITVDQTTAPDGSNNGDLILGDGSAAGIKGINKTANNSAGSFDFSVYAKDGLNFQWLRLSGISAGVSAWFDIVNGVLGTTQGAITRQIIPAANGWFQCSINFTSAGNEGIAIRLADGDGVNNASGTTSDGCYLYGPNPVF